MGSDGDVGCKAPWTLHIFASASEFTSSLIAKLLCRGVLGKCNASLRLSLGIFFHCWWLVYFALIFRVIQWPKKDFFPSNKATAAQPPRGPQTCSIWSVTISLGSHNVAHAWSKLFLGHCDCFPTLGHNRRSFQQHFLWKIIHLTLFLESAPCSAQEEVNYCLGGEGVCSQMF